MDPQNYDAYGGLDHVQYCFEVTPVNLAYKISLCYVDTHFGYSRPGNGLGMIWDPVWPHPNEIYF